MDFFSQQEAQRRRRALDAFFEPANRKIYETSQYYLGQPMTNFLSSVSKVPEVFSSAADIAEATAASKRLMQSQGLLNTARNVGQFGATMAGALMPGNQSGVMSMAQKGTTVKPPVLPPSQAMGLLAPDELKTITPKTQGLLDTAFGTQNQKQLAAMTYAGAPKMGWYQASGQAIKSVFGKDSLRFNKLLAALSPQTSVEDNLDNTVRVWSNWIKAGRPSDPVEINKILGQSVQGTKGDDSVLDAWRNNTIRSLSTENAEDIILSGAKVDSFAEAIEGNLDKVVLDAWMANAGGVPQSLFAKRQGLPGYSPGYLGVTGAVRQVAQDTSKATGMDIKPSNVQENVWSFAKALMEARQAQGLSGLSATDLIKEGRISADVIGNVADFSTLLTDPRYADVLRSAGYGKQIDELVANAKPREFPDFSSYIDPTDLEASARTIEQLYQFREYTSRTAPYRVGYRSGETLSESGYRSQPRGSNETRTVGVAKGVIFEAGDGFKKAVSPLYDKQVSIPNYVRLNKDPVSVKEFVRFSNNNKQATPYPSMVDVHSPNKYKGAKLFLTETGDAGMAIMKDGEIASVVKNQNSPIRNFTLSSLQVATQEGGTYLNAYDTVLPDFYSRSGFKPVARIKWNDEFAPSDWNYNDPIMKKFNNARPDIVFMAYDPKFRETVKNGLGGRTFTGSDAYEQAQAHTLKEVEKLKSKANK